MKRAHRALLLSACMACAVVAADASAKGFRYTHSVTVSGQFEDIWSRTAKDNCSFQGSGETTISFTWTKAFKVAPRVDPFAGAKGQWVLFILLADRGNPRPADVFSDPLALPSRTILVTALPARLTRYTTTITGGATPVGTDCDPPDGKPCRTGTKTRKSDLSGFDRRKLTFEANIEPPVSEGVCTTGTIEGWSSPIFKNRADLFVKMPKPKTFARRKTVVVRGADSGHQNIDYFGTQLDETVTRSVTATFKKL